MSGKKISEMTAITGAQLDQTNDVLPILDVSDTSNPNKKISIQELASALGGTTNVSLVLDGSNNLILTDSDGNNVTADLSSLLDDTNTTNASLSLATNTLTLTDSASNSVDVDLSSLDNSGLTLADVTANGGTTNQEIFIGTQDTSSNRIFNVVGSYGVPAAKFVRVGDFGPILEFGRDGLSFMSIGQPADNAISFSNATGNVLYVSSGGLAVSGSSSGTTPTVTLDIQGTDAVQLTAGTEAQRPDALTVANGMIRYNSDDDVFEGYAGGAWGKNVLADENDRVYLGNNTKASQTNIYLNNRKADANNIWFQSAGSDLAGIGRLANSDNVALVSSGYLTMNFAGQKVGILTTPTVTLDIQGTDAVQLTAGTEAQRPTTPANGMIRYNSDDDVFEGYAGDSGIGDGSWVKTSGLTLADVTANGNFTNDNVGIGITPSSYKLQVASGTGAGVLVQNTDTPSGLLLFNGSTVNQLYSWGATASTDKSLAILTGTTERMRISLNGNIGINTSSPSVKLVVNGTDAVQLTSGTTAQRPTTPANGMIRYNSDDDVFEGYAGDTGIGDGSWVKTSGLTLADVTANGASTSSVIIAASARLTSPVSGLGAFCHKDIFAINDVAIYQNASGQTVVNSKLGQNLDLRNNNTLVGRVNTNGIGIFKTPTVTLDIQGTDAVQLTTGTTLEQPGQVGQPTAAAGMIRFNTTTSKFEGYDGTSWIDLN